MDYPQVDYTEGLFWLQAGHFAATAAIAAWVAIISRTRYNARQLRDHERAVDGRLDKIEQSVACIQERLDLQPDPAEQTKSIGRVHGRIDELSKDVHEMRGLMSGIRSSVGRISDHLLTAKR